MRLPDRQRRPAFRGVAVRLPDRQRSRAVLIGTGRYADGKLPDLPVVRRTIRDLTAVLTDPVYGVVAKNHCTVLEDQADIRLIGRALTSAASQAADLLLVYFVGHGLVAGRRHDLYLGLPGSEWAEPEFNSLEYDKLRSAVLDSAAATKIIILDCCFSGRVVSEADPVTEMVGQMEVEGTYVLASAGRDQVALIQPGEDHTAFTGRFLHMLRNGVPGGPEFLTVDYLYQQLLARMKAEGLSQPKKRGTSTLRTLAGHTAAVLGVAFSPDGRLLATTSDDMTARLWDPATGKRLRTLADHPDAVSSVAFSPDGRLLATAGGDGMAWLWDPATGARLHILTGHTAAVVGVAFSPDGRLLATASVLRTLAGHTAAVLGVAFSPDGRLLATTSDDMTARLWDPATGKRLRTLIGHTPVVSGVAFSPDGRLLATASVDGMAWLWDPATGKRLRTLADHPVMVSGVAFSPDGRLLATASYDKTARLWDPATGARLHILTGHTAAVKEVAFSPDGRLLATASVDKTARVWG